MKNFTKQNFKTNPLWIRLLIMTFMLLVGSSSAWGAIYLKGSFNGWGTSNTFDGNGNCTITLNKGDYTFKIDDNGTWYGNGESITRSNCLNVTIGGPYGSDMKLKVDVTGSYKFYWNGYQKKLTVTYPPECTQCCDKVEIKHPWGGGSWTYKTAEKCDGTVYSLEAKYGNNGCNWKLNDGNDNWISQQDSKFILVGSPSVGDDCTFSFNTSNNTITITKVVTCDNNPDFSVSLSKSEVAVGCTGVTASIKGNDSPTVTWSSSKTSVATINSSTGAITIKAAGTTTITATTTEAGGFCGGVKKTATLTVKSPSVTVKENDNSLCERETLTITATLTNCGEGNSIQWYKGDDLIADETSATLTISSVTTANSGNYKAVVSGGILCSNVESTPITITVNALPSAPSLSNPESICYGTPFTLPEKDNNKKTITWNVNNRELTNLSVGPHTYTAKIVENGCESTTVDYIITVKEQLAKPDLAVTNVKQCGSNYTEGKIVINHYNPANTYILKKDGTPITKDYNEGYAISETETGEYTVEVSKDGACGATSDDVTIEVINNTPTVNSFAITKQPNVCMGNPVTLSYDDTEQSGDITYAWYEGTNREVLGTEKTFTIQQAKNATYKLVVTVTSNDCPASAEATTTVEPKAVPSAPTFDEYEMDACVNQQFTLPKPNNLIGEEEALWTVEGRPTNASQTINVADDYKYIAYKNDGCPSQGTPFTVRVNSLPTINIGEDVTAVLYEDVVLTATGENIDNVVWTADKGTITKDPTDPKQAVLTYDQTGDVIVTAKAISAAGCESAEVSKKVTFSAETCKPTTITVPANYIEIYCKYNDAPTQHDMKVDIWKQSEGQGTESYQSCSKSVDGYAYWKFNITDDATYCIRISNKELNYKSGSMCTLTRGHKYYFDIPGGWSGWTNGPDKSKTQDITETQDGPPAITTPAVKTVSATSEEGSGTVTFTGQIIKTGCAATSKIYYGYQCKKADEEWPTTGVEASNTPVEGKLIPLTNASETALYYQFSANVENLEDVDYHFRAYIINGYDFTNGNYDQGVYYGLDKLVTVSTVQTAVKTAEIELVNQDGTSVEPGHKYCVGETGYIKVTSDVKYTTATWKSDLGVEIEQIGKTNIYQFEVKGKDQIVVLLSNKHNTEPVSSNPREVDVYASPSVPEIALGESSICDTNEDGTTLTVTRTKAGQYYALYKEDGNGGIKVEDYQLCSSDNAAIEYTGLKESAKYFVKTYRGECDSEITRSSSATLTVVDSKDVKISIEPTDTETTPWMPAKLTVTATSDYTVTSVPNDAVINISGNIVKVKLPLPTEGVQNKSTTKDNVNVTFDNITYTITAELRTAGEEGNPCAQPAIANITLTPYIEICD